MTILPHDQLGTRRSRRPTSTRREVVFRTASAGLGAVLGPLEGMVLHALWAESPMEVKRLQHLLTLHGHALALSTIQTTINRLVEKGWVQRHPGRGAGAGCGHTYLPVFDESGFRTHIVMSLLDAIPEFATVESLTDQAMLVRAALRALQRLAHHAAIETEIDMRDAPALHDELGAVV